MKTNLLLATGALTLVLVAALVISGCGDGKKSASTGPGTESAASTSANLPTDAKVVGVDAVAKDPKKHAGRVAIEGVVAKVFTVRGAFNLIDVTEFAACGTTDCAEYSVPVLVPKDEFQGDLPKEKETVLVIGDVQPNEKGYLFVVQEVRRKDATILSRTKAPSSKPAQGSSEERAQFSDCLPGTLLANKDTLALTAEQVANLNTIQTAFSEAQGRLQKKITHCQGELVELLEKKPIDQAKVDHEKKEVEEFKGELAKEQRTAEVAARAVLTPEQAKRVPEPAEGEC